MAKLIANFSDIDILASLKRGFDAIPMEFWYILIAISSFWLIYLIIGIGLRRNGVAVIVNRYRTIFYVISLITVLYFTIYFYQIGKSIKEGKLAIIISQIFIFLAIAVSMVSSIIIYSLIKAIKNCPSEKKKSFTNVMLIITVIFFVLIFAILLLASEIVNFANIVDDKLIFGKESSYIFAYAFAILAIGISVYSAKNDNYKANDGKAFFEGLITLVFAIVLSKLPFASIFNFTGIIYLAVVPIVIYSFRYGTYKGMIVAFYSGALVGLLNYNIVSPVQYFALYPASFVLLSFVSALLKQYPKRPILGVFLALFLVQVLRLVLSVSVNYFYTPVRKNPFNMSRILYMTLTGGYKMIFEWIYSSLILIMIMVQRSTREKMLVDRYNNLITNIAQ